MNQSNTLTVLLLFRNNRSIMNEERIERTRSAFGRYQDDSVNKLSYQQMALSQASLAQNTTLLKACWVRV